MLNSSLSSLKGLLPKDRSTQQFLKRIIIVVTLFSVIGVLITSSPPNHLLLNVVFFLLFAFLFGCIDMLLVQKSREKLRDNNESLAFSAFLLAVIGLLAAGVPLAIQGDFLLAFGALLFALPHIVYQLITGWDRKPRVIPPSAEVLPWRSAFIEGLLAKTRFYLVFRIRYDSKQYKVGWSVDPQVLLTPNKEMTLQKLFSNWVIRENNQVRGTDLIPLLVLDQGQKHNIQWVFSRRKWLFFKSIVSPYSRISKLPLLWWPKIELVGGRLRFIYTIEFTVESFQ